MAKIADAVQAAVVGPERKKLKIYDHEFNVRPAEIIERRENYLRVRGHISHHLRWRNDDQVYYVIEIENGLLKPIQLPDIARGGFALFAGPAASIIGAYYGVPIPPDLAEKISRELGRIAEGSWEQAVNAVIGEIALAFQQRESAAGTPGKVKGAIRDKWMELGGEQGLLGQALTDETPTPDGGGRYNHFQGGLIYWTPETGAHEVHGWIRNKWAELGWELSALRYPTTDEMPMPDGVSRFNDFQGGSIRWHPDTGAQLS